MRQPNTRRCLACAVVSAGGAASKAQGSAAYASAALVVPEYAATSASRWEWPGSDETPSGSPLECALLTNAARE